jgi:7-keto-8-aminopelargonate synthetase-like enzyme
MTVADKLCEFADITLRQGIDIPATRHPVVEVAEYPFRVNFQRTATPDTISRIVLIPGCGTRPRSR